MSTYVVICKLNAEMDESEPHNKFWRGILSILWTKRGNHTWVVNTQENMPLGEVHVHFKPVLRVLSP